MRRGARLASVVTILATLTASCGAQSSATPGGPSGSSSAPSASSTPGATATATATAAASGERAIVLGGTPMGPCNAIPRAKCGLLSVREDRSGSSDRRIDIHVMVVPSLATQPAPDPLFVLAGGPGGAATALATWAPGTFSDLLATRDMVFVDQRGTGGSNELRFPTRPDFSGLSDAERDQKAAEWAGKALSAFDADASQYTTSVAMDDLDEVRAALGYDRIDLYGASYGATAIQYYLRQHPDHVRTAILDGGTLVDVPIFERVAANSQRALDLVLARCLADSACRRAYPDVRGETAAVFARLAKGPISVPTAGAATTNTLDRDSWTSAIHGALLDATVAAYIPAGVHLVATKDWARFSELLAALGNKQGSEPDLVMSQVIRCSEAWATFGPAEVRRTGAGSYLLAVQEAGAKTQEAVCGSVPRGVVPPNDAEPVRTDLPVLVILGSADPQNPPANVADAPTDMPNSRTVIADGFGHTVGHLGCMPTVISAFVAAGTVDDLDTSCVSRMSPPPFVIP